MSIPELEIALQKARERQRKAMTALAPKHQGGEWEEFLSLREAVLDAERALAAAKGEQFAVAMDFPISWDTGAPLPYLLQNDYQTFLIFFIRHAHPPGAGAQAGVLQPGSPLVQKLAVVEFEGCTCAKMGTPNDEVFRGHPLYGRGFAGDRAMAVQNSSWIKELEAINAVHSRYQPESWRKLKHYILPFHDSTFECVARSFKVETFDTSLPHLLAEICRRLVE